MSDCFLFFRLWPGFSEPFPFDRFDGITEDDDLLQALNSWAREEIRRPEARRAIMQVARWRKHEWLAAIQKRRGVEAMRPGRPRNIPSGRSLSRRVSARDVYWPRIRQPERPEPLVCRFGFDLGWWREVGCFGADIPLWRERGDNSLPFGPRVWFDQVPSSELAETVVSALNGRTDLDFDDHKEEYYLRPRFGVVEDTDVALRISALRCIKSIQQGKIPEVRSGEMAVAMGQKAMAIADEMLEAAAPPTPVQAVLAPLLSGHATTNTDSTPTGKTGESEGNARAGLMPEKPTDEQPPPPGTGKSEGDGGDGPTPKKSQLTKPADKTPKRGRPVDPLTVQRADFAKPLREKAQTWEDIATDYRKKHVKDLEASADTLRLAFQRQYPEPK